MIFALNLTYRVLISGLYGVFDSVLRCCCILRFFLRYCGICRFFLRFCGICGVQKPPHVPLRKRRVSYLPKYSGTLFNEVLDITNDTLRPGQNYSKIYGIKPRYNEPRYNEFLDITNIIRKPERKIYLDLTNCNVKTSLLRSRSGRSHVTLPVPTRLLQTDIHSFLGNKPINVWLSFCCECSRL